MDSHTPEYQYVAGQRRERFPALFAAFESANDRTLAALAWQLDIPYGAHARETFDLCPAIAPARGTVVYLHAGYWQSRDKAQFRFLAPALCAAGFNVALAGYPLCPDVTLAALTAGVRKTLPAVAAALPPDQRGLPLIVAGHSAGGHLAVELALSQGPDTPRETRIAGIVPISGIYDLAPLVQTTLNERLRLDAGQARACSPRFRLRAGLPAAIFVVGKEETAEFLRQNDEMAQAWRASGNAAQSIAVEGQDHFSLLEVLARPDGLLVGWVGELAAGVT